MSETKRGAISAKFRNLSAKAVTAASVIATTVMMNPTVFAASEAKGKLLEILEQLMPALAVIGIPIALIGGFKLLMAFRDDQGDAVTAAARELAIGIVITFFAAIGGNILKSL